MSDEERYRGFKSPQRALHTLCCCGCLFPLFLLKTCFTLPLTLLWAYVVGGTIAVIHFVRLVPQILWAIMIHQRFSWRVAMLVMALFTIPCALFFPFIVLGATFMGLVFGVFGAGEMTFNKSYPVYEITHIWGEIMRVTESWWDVASEMERDIHRFRDKPLRVGEMPYDIRFSVLVFGLLLMAVSFAVILPFWILVSVIKLPFGIAIIYAAFKEAVVDKSDEDKSWVWAIFCSPCLIACAALIPVGGVLYLVLSILHGVGVCLAIPFIYYDEHSVVHTLWFMPLVVREYDRRTTALITDYFDWTCLSYGTVFELCGMCEVPAKDQSLTDKIDSLVVYDERSGFNNSGNALCCDGCIA